VRYPRAAIAILSLAAALALIELSLRFTGFSPPRLLPASIRATYRLEPGARFVYRGFLPGTFEDFANAVELNRFGFHDRDHPFERSDTAAFRVMVLGDSYVAAFEVSLDESFRARLETRLRREDPLRRGSYEVIAFGQGNRAQQAELEWLRRFAPLYRPDLVLVVFFCGNDVMENSPTLFAQAKRFGARYLREVVPRKEAMFARLLLFPRSRLNGVVAERLTDLYAQNLFRFHPGLTAEDLTSPELGIYRRPLAPEWKEAFERTGSLLDAIREEARRLPARFAIASLSGPQAVGDVARARLSSGAERDLDLARPERWISAWARDRGVSHVALGRYLAEAGRDRVFWCHDAHLTPEGHAVVADALFAFVVEAMSGVAGS
jgi:lysophospholipase L1-like esterase